MNTLKKALWYRQRLASMSVEEVFHRLDEAIKRRLDKISGPLMPLDYGSFAPLPHLRERLDAADIPTDVLKDWNELWQQAQSGQLTLLNKQWPKSVRGKAWHFDPITHKYWPDNVYSFDINYRHNNEMGDIKYVWELNRLQYLQPIAAFAFKNRDSDAAHFCLQEIESWIDHNPPYNGVNWTSGIELSLRAVSMLIALAFVGEYLTEAQRIKIWSTLEAHGEWLARYPSKFSSANNHRTAEGLGLFVIGSLCPQLPCAEQWKTMGWGILCESSYTQILADGAGAEQAVSYAAIVLEMLLFGGMIAATTGIDTAPLYQKQIELGGEFLRWITDNGGHQPHIGDDDNGSVIGLHTDDYVSSILSCIATVTNRQDLMPPNLSPQLRQFLFGVPPVSADAPRGVKAFPEGGYTVARHAIDNRDVMLLMDHGNLGFLSIAAHGHADALSLWVHVDNQPVFVDAGTYLYHSGGAKRDMFRGTAAHNTLCLNHTDSSTMAGAFNWSHKANTRVVASHLTTDDWFVEAEHDGYLKKYNAVHRRRVERNAATVTVTDYLVSDMRHSVEIGYLLHPDLTVQWDAGRFLIKKADRLLLALRYDGPLKTEIRRDAAYSPSFGIKQTTTRIVFAGDLYPQQKSVLHLLFGEG